MDSEAESSVPANSDGLKSYTVNIYPSQAENIGIAKIYIVLAPSRHEAELLGLKEFRLYYPDAKIDRILTIGPYDR